MVHILQIFPQKAALPLGHLRLRKVEKGIQIAENLFKNFMWRGLNLQMVLHGCYAMRIPVFYLERYIHDQKKKTVLEMFSDGFFVASDLAGAANFFSKYTFRHLGKSAVKFLNGPLGKILKKIPFPPVLSAFRGLGHLCYGAYSFKRLFDPATSKADKRQACIDIACTIAEVAYSILFLAGCSFAPLMISLSVIALTLMVVSVAHSIFVSIRKSRERRVS